MQNTFGDFLKQKRQEKQLTQKELAKLLFVSDSAVSKWEKGVAHPDISLLPTLAQILEVTEHELITASVDTVARKEKAQAKKWQALSLSWHLFFYIAYGVTLLTCFIVNLAVSKALTWFWIVFASLLLAFTFTSLPRFIKKYRLIFIPLSMYLALCLLLGVCAIYTQGDWFFLASVPTLVGLLFIFTPIYIANYKAFERVKKFGAFLSLAIDFIALNIMLLIIEGYTLAGGHATTHWYFPFALPISFIVYAAVNLLVGVGYLKINKPFKTAIILILSALFLYLPPMFIKTSDVWVQKELNDTNILLANFSTWNLATIEPNIHLIVFLSAVGIAAVFALVGVLLCLAKRKNKA